MIDYFQIQRLSSQKAISEEIIEKDYFIELLLFYLSNNPYFSKKMIFRGGTALKKIYFPEYRYSEDLDFILLKNENFGDSENKLDKILLKISADFPFKPIKVSSIKNDRLQIFITYNIANEIKSVKELKVDIVKDTFIPYFENKKIIFTFKDFRGNNHDLNTCTLESIVVDKILRITDVDKEARDIYDLWHILKLNLNIGKISEQFRKRTGYNPFFQDLINAVNSPIYKQTWKLRLEKQVLKLPAYETVAEELEDLIKNKLIPVEDNR